MRRKVLAHSMMRKRQRWPEGGRTTRMASFLSRGEPEAAAAGRRRRPPPQAAAAGRRRRPPPQAAACRRRLRPFMHYFLCTKGMCESQVLWGHPSSLVVLHTAVTWRACGVRWGGLGEFSRGINDAENKVIGPLLGLKIGLKSADKSCRYGLRTNISRRGRP